MTLLYEAAENISAVTNEGEKAAHVIYIGDFDPAGVLIDRVIERDLRATSKVLPKALQARVFRGARLEEILPEKLTPHFASSETRSAPMNLQDRTQ